MSILSCSLSPNTESDDITTAIKVLLMPWCWQKGSAVTVLQKWFKEYFLTEHIYFCDSGRSALYMLLKAMGIGKGDEVILQAFTCVAVPNSVLWNGAIPIYADIDDTYNIDPKEVEKKISPHTKAIILQHTFGVPAQIEMLVTLAKKHNLVLIEDCAHALGGEYKGKKLGTFGDAAIFSFGRDKPFSSIWGGAIIINAKCLVPDAKYNLKKLHISLHYPSRYWIMQQLLHPICFGFILPLYNMGIGKIFLIILQKLRLLSVPIFPEEKRGGMPDMFPKNYSNALAALLVHQLSKIDRYTENRKKIARVYDKFFEKSNAVKRPKYTNDASWLRYCIQVTEPIRYIKKAKSKGILFGNWYHHVVDPQGTLFDKIGYVKGSCPKAENAAKHVINLPTRIDTDAAKKITNVFL